MYSKVFIEIHENHRINDDVFAARKALRNDVSKNVITLS